MPSTAHVRTRWRPIQRHETRDRYPRLKAKRRDVLHLLHQDYAERSGGRRAKHEQQSRRHRKSGSPDDQQHAGQRQGDPAPRRQWIRSCRISTDNKVVIGTPA